MVKILFFEPLFENHEKYNNFDLNILIKLVYDKYTLKSERDANVNLLINELRKDKDILEKYDSLKYDIIDEDEDYYTAIDTITDEVYENFDINIIIDDLIELFDLDCVSNGKQYCMYDIYFCTNEKVIDIILSLESDVKYNVLNKSYFNIYYVEIQDEISKYINLSYEKPNKIQLKSNHFALLNEQSKQYMVINKNKEDLSDYYNHYDYHLILYYDYDKYFKDNLKKYITKYKELFTLNK